MALTGEPCTSSPSRRQTSPVCENHPASADLAKGRTCEMVGVEGGGALLEERVSDAKMHLTVDDMDARKEGEVARSPSHEQPSSLSAPLGRLNKEVGDATGGTEVLSALSPRTPQEVCWSPTEMPRAPKKYYSEALGVHWAEEKRSGHARVKRRLQF